MNPCNLISESAPCGGVNQRNGFLGMSCNLERLFLKGIRAYYGMQRWKEFGDCLKLITEGFKETVGMCKTADGTFSIRAKGKGGIKKDRKGKKEGENRGKSVMGKQAAGKHITLGHQNLC